MSEQANIGNSVFTFDFSIFLHKNEPKAIPGKGAATSISKGSIQYLEIEDNLAQYGYVGNVTFSNFAGILDKLGLSGGTNKNSLLFDINIKSDDFNGKDPDNTTIKALVQLQDSADKIKNSIDRKLQFKFEELQPAQLRQHNVDPTHPSLVKSKNIGEALINTLTFDAGNGTTKGGTAKTEETPKLVPGVITNGDSYYDVSHKLYKLYYFKEHGPGLVQLATKSSKRVFNITALGVFVKDFIKAANGNSLSKWVIDGFTLAPLESNRQNDFRESSIEKFDLHKPQYEQLFREKWLNYTVTQHNERDVTTTKNNTITYQSLKEEFEKVVCGGKKSNLPARIDTGGQDIKYTSLKSEFPIGDENLNVTAMKNRTFKSFIYDNTAISFKVTGSPHRKPGFFIMLNDTKKKNDENELTGYWYIISVKHIFENDIYTNEIVAVKFFSM